MCKRRSKGILTVIFSCVLAFLMGCGITSNEVAKEQESQIKEQGLQIDASSAFFPMTEDIVETVFKDSDSAMPQVKMVATDDGFSDISSGKTDLLISSIPNEQQERRLKEADEEFERIPITQEPLVILVNKENPVDSITMEQLTAMYLEENQNWIEYGGDDLPVTTYQLTEGNGSQTAFSQYINGVKIADNHREITLMNEIVDAVGSDPGGICYAFDSYIFRMYSNSDIKLVKIDGKDFDDPDYPLTCMVSAYYRKEAHDSDFERIVTYLRADETANLLG